MNRMFKALGVALALGISITAAVAADSHRGPDDGKGGPHGFRALNLTDAQKTQMKALHQEQGDAFGGRMKELRDAHQALRTQVFADKPDDAQIESLKGKIAGLQTDMLAARVDMDRKVAAILTPEQRQKMASMPPFGGGRFRGHHGRHHGQGGPDGGAPSPDGPGQGQ